MVEDHRPGSGEPEPLGASNPADVETALASIRDVAAELMRQPSVASDSECRHLMFLLALAEDPEELDALADRLAGRARALAGSPAPLAIEAPAPSARAARVLFRL